MRFMMTSQTEHWRQIVAAAKSVARMANTSEPAAYGNLGSAMTTNYVSTQAIILGSIKRRRLGPIKRRNVFLKDCL